MTLGLIYMGLIYMGLIYMGLIHKYAKYSKNFETIIDENQSHHNIWATKYG